MKQVWTISNILYCIVKLSVFSLWSTFKLLSVVDFEYRFSIFVHCQIENWRECGMVNIDGNEYLHLYSMLAMFILTFISGDYKTYLFNLKEVEGKRHFFWNFARSSWDLRKYEVGFKCLMNRPCMLCHVPFTSLNNSTDTGVLVTSRHWFLSAIDMQMWELNMITNKDFYDITVLRTWWEYKTCRTLGCLIIQILTLWGQQLALMMLYRSFPSRKGYNSHLLCWALSER